MLARYIRYIYVYEYSLQCHPPRACPSPELISFLRSSLVIPLHPPRSLPCAFRTTQRPPHHSLPTVLRRPPQCRTLHLYKTARARTTLGMHKILPFDQYQIPPPHKSDQKINLWTRPGGAQIAEGLSLEELLENHIKPGHMLYLAQQMKKSHSENYVYLKENKVPNEFNNYAIIEQGKMPVKIAKQKKRSDQSPWVRDLAGLKEIHLNLASPRTYWQMVLCRAYAFLDNMHQVDCSIRLKGAFANKKERREPGSPEIWPWMHQHFPHLRPDFIRKSMPEGTYFMIEPFSDGKHVQFVLAMPHRTVQTDKVDQSFTDRVLMIKNRASKSIKEGKQSELPKML
ncbi:hypothetical protein K505DRAFT_306172 [Melanomma pulvis-pyrius CBS 109.77]|uniref:Uncharacterized protein n=1 Tax=Melanomma pulvis-pyrius CBS 109.77 TaxID=1314802 RepID=A0A6A6XBZ1_9PLEO|nr:hypothetical protein K505DRAFT_306172 [Melanomma pulvis-pyrius CBS 109.77]